MNPSSKEGELVYPLPSDESLDFVDGTENCCAWFYPSKIGCFTPSTKWLVLGQRSFRILWRMTPNVVPWAAEIEQQRFRKRFNERLSLTEKVICLGEVYKLYLYQSLPMVHGPLVETRVCMNLVWLHHCLESIAVSCYVKKLWSLTFYVKHRGKQLENPPRNFHPLHIDPAQPLY